MPNLINQHVKQIRRLTMIVSFLINAYTNTLPFHAVRRSLRKTRNMRRFDIHMGITFEVQTALVMIIQVFWGKTPYLLANSCRMFRTTLPCLQGVRSPMNCPDSQDGGRQLVRNVGNYSLLSVALRSNISSKWVFTIS